MGYDEETPSNSHLYICSQGLDDQDLHGTHRSSVVSQGCSPTGVGDGTENPSSNDDTTRSSDLNTHDKGNLGLFRFLANDHVFSVLQQCLVTTPWRYQDRHLLRYKRNTFDDTQWPCYFTMFDFLVCKSY